MNTYDMIFGVLGLATVYILLRPIVVAMISLVKRQEAAFQSSKEANDELKKLIQSRANEASSGDWWKNQQETGS